MSMLNTFEEEQKFRQKWLWPLILGLPLLFTFSIISEHFRDRPLPVFELIILLSMPWATVLLFWILTLKTKIDNVGIVIQFYPFRKKRIGWDEVVSAEVLRYGYIGGLGIRKFTKYGTVYNVDGKMGLALQLKNGKKICIGTQKEDDLRKFIEMIDKA